MYMFIYIYTYIYKYIYCNIHIHSTYLAVRVAGPPWAAGPLAKRRRRAGVGGRSRRRPERRWQASLAAY